MAHAGRRWRGLLAAGLAGLALNVAPAVAQGQEPPEPTTTTVAPAPPAPPAPPVVTGPVPRDAGRYRGPVTRATDPLAERGYVEEEVFLEGSATAYAQEGRWGEDGRWSVRPTGQAPYRTRLLVRRPADPDDFDGTVLVSWLNVGGAFDLDPEWAQVGEELMRRGAAFVGVSAQALGVEGPLGARRWDPARYGQLSLASDSLGYDVFTHAGRSLAAPGAVDPLRGLPGDRRLIASGQGQSAQRLVTYLNAFHPDAQVYDGFLLLSRFPGAAPLGDAPPPARGVLSADDASPADRLLPDPVVALLAGPSRAQIREDSDVPVFVVLTETEAVASSGVGRRDSDRFRTWEIAGAAHTDATATAATKAKLARDFPNLPLDQLDCPQANVFPAHHALRAAVRAMAEWVDGGDAPPTASRLARDEGGDIRRDADGNALGGLRLPDLDVPTATHTGRSDGDGYCALTGSTVPFSSAELAERYPTPEGYAQALAAAVEDAVAAGYLLPEEAQGILAAADDRFVSARAAAAAGAGRNDDRGWMATTGRDLITPLLVGLLLLLNGWVVLTVANQRRRGSRLGP